MQRHTPYLAILGLVLLPIGSGCQKPVPTATPAPSPTPLPLRSDLMERLQQLTDLLNQDDPRVLTQLEELEKDARQEKDDTQAGLLLAGLLTIYEQLDFTDKVASVSAEALRRAPKQAPILVHRGRFEQQLGNFKEAERLLIEAATLEPNSPLPQLALVFLYQTLTDYPKMEKAAREAIRLAPDNGNFRMILHQALIQQRRYDDAMKVLDEASRMTLDSKIVTLQKAFTLGEIARNTPDKAAALRKEAIGLIEGVIQQQPDSTEAYFMLGRLRQDSGDDKGALTAWKKAYELDPSYRGLRSVLSLSLARAGERDLAHKVMDEARQRDDASNTYMNMVRQVAEHPTDLALRKKLARWCAAHRLISRAIYEWDQVLQHQPADPDAAKEAKALRARRMQEMVR